MSNRTLHADEIILGSERGEHLRLSSQGVEFFQVNHCLRARFILDDGQPTVTCMTPPPKSASALLSRQGERPSSHYRTATAPPVQAPICRQVARHASALLMQTASNAWN